MDKVDLKTEQHSDRKDEQIWERLSSETNVSGMFDSQPASFKEIVFGNTGFVVKIGETKVYSARFDFTPEGISRFHPDTAAKYASMLACGLFGLYKFLNDHNKMADNEISSYNLPWIYATTKTRLVVSLQNLFSLYGSAELIQIEDNLSRVGISLKGFRNLKPDSALILYLERVSQRARNTKVAIRTSIEES